MKAGIIAEISPKSASTSISESTVNFDRLALQTARDPEKMKYLLGELKRSQATLSKHTVMTASDNNELLVVSLQTRFPAVINLFEKRQTVYRFHSIADLEAGRSSPKGCISDLAKDLSATLAMNPRALPKPWRPSMLRTMKILLKTSWIGWTLEQLIDVPNSLG